MSITTCSNTRIYSSFDKREATSQKKISFGATSAPVYKVQNPSILKKLLPAIAFFASAITTVGYATGAAGLFYDSYKENDSNIKKMFLGKKEKCSKSEGVQTIKTSTEFGKFGLNAAKIAITASASAGVACGLGEGVPMMALGEATNMSAGRIIETPVGTGLFGIGIASIFAGLALENTPELKLNEFKYMAENDTSKKAKMVAKNMWGTLKEITSSVGEVAKNITNTKFLKENIFNINPKTVVFQEKVNKDGKVFIERSLRHNKNYLMHASSFTLGLGGIGVVLFSLLKNKKAQKASLHVEEGGFLIDNVGILKYGIDKASVGAKPAGAGYAVGGIINAISQFIGLDNKNGRAMQWAGISLVFVGYAIDRGKHFKVAMANSKARTELRDTVREWRVDLSKIAGSSDEMKKIIEELKQNKPVTNEKFKKLEQVFEESTKGKFKSDDEMKSSLSQHIAVDGISSKKIADFKETQEALKACTKKLFGSDNPTPEA